jgi:hypothetical protein
MTFWNSVSPNASYLSNLMVKQIASEMGSASLRQKTLSVGIALKLVKFSQWPRSDINNRPAS